MTVTWHSWQLHFYTYRSADKSLARPGRKQANVSVRMAWISFRALLCRKKKLMTARVLMLLKSRASLMFPSLFLFLVGLRTYQHPGTNITTLFVTHSNHKGFFVFWSSTKTFQDPPLPPPKIAMHRHQPISVADFGWRVNHVKRLTSSCPQNLFFFLLLIFDLAALQPLLWVEPKTRQWITSHSCTATIPETSC